MKLPLAFVLGGVACALVLFIMVVSDAPQATIDKMLLVFAAVAGGTIPGIVLFFFGIAVGRSTARRELYDQRQIDASRADFERSMLPPQPNPVIVLQPDAIKTPEVVRPLRPTQPFSAAATEHEETWNNL